MTGLRRFAICLSIVIFVLVGVFILGLAVAPATSAVSAGVDQPADRITVNVYLPLIRRGGTTVCGEITADSTWTASGSPYQVACDVIVVHGIMLTIEAGATVQFNHVEDDLIISGTLQALGTASAPIHFQPVSGAVAGSWGQVAFRPGSSGVLDHAILEYGGSNFSMVSIASDAVQVLNSVVQYSNSRGITILSASPLISATQILNNLASGLHNDYGSPTIQNNNFVGNSGGDGGGLINFYGSPIIQNNTFTGNSAKSGSSGSGGGGGLYNRGGSPIIQNNTFTGNTVVGFGGGLFIENGSAIIQNNIFAGNSAHDGGGGLYISSGNTLIQNNVFAGNTAYNEQGGGIFNRFGDPVIRNNIVVNNTAGYGGGGIAFYPYQVSYSLDYNNVWNNSGGDYINVNPGAHDISADPLFTDPANGDFHLASGSVCIDASDPDHHPETDFEGDPRPMGLGPDIGADEYRALEVVKTNLPVEASPGAPITYTVKIVNRTPVTLTNVLLTDTLPVETTLTGFQAEGLTCTHAGAAWGGTLNCMLESPSLLPGDSRALTVTVRLTDTFTSPQFVTNIVSSNARADGETFNAQDQARTWVKWCTVRWNETFMGDDLQAAIDASTQITDVVKVSGYCLVHDLNLNKTLVLQGRWRQDFGERDGNIYTTTLDGQSLGRVILIDGDVAPTIEGFVITNGKTDGVGGGISIPSGSPIIQGNTIAGNSAYGLQGGGLYIGTGSPLIQLNTFIKNAAYGKDGYPAGPAGTGGGLYNGAGNPTIQFNSFISNGAFGSGLGYDTGEGGGVYNYSGIPVIQNNTFSNNLAYGYTGNGGGIYILSGNLIIQHNIFTGNSTGAWGNGFSGGGGLFITWGSSTIQNNIFTGGGLETWSASVTIRSNIFVHSSIYTRAPTVMEYNNLWYSDSNVHGPYDISADPLLVNPDTGDFHLAPGSPCIDAGDPYNHPETDFEGDPRPMGLAPDIGVDEYRTLRVAKAITPDEVLPGAPITYTITLANPTTISLTSVLLTDTLQVETALTGYQAEGLTCVHDGSAWGGQVSCTLNDPILSPGESHVLIVTVRLTETVAMHRYITNLVDATASAGGETLMAHDLTHTWVNGCEVHLNDTAMENGLQAAIDASTYVTDVIKVSGYCTARDLNLNKTLTMQGGWRYDFVERNVTVFTTTLDAQNLGRVILVDGEVTPTIEGFVITGGKVEGLGGGIFIPTGSPTIQNNIFSNNLASHRYGGGLYNGSGNPIIQDNKFTGNIADYGGGLANGSGNPIIQNNQFTGNAATYGGGLANESGNPIIQNNFFISNYGAFGGGLHNNSGSPLIQNNTFDGNYGSEVYRGGGVYNGSGSPTIRSNIVVNNISGLGGGIYNDSGIPTLDYNDVWNNTGGDYYGVTPGPHDISSDPLLVDPANNDFHLAPGSPCIDAGDPLNFPPTDFEGDPRPMGLAPDIGADEYLSGGL